MSFQSDILGSEDQKYLFDQVGDFPLFQDLHNEETYQLVDDVQQDFKLQVKPRQASVLTNEEYIGPFTFEVDIIPNGTKNAWVYSSALNKVYMTMRTPFPVDFKVKFRPQCPLYIRVTPMYSSPQYAQECVYRCMNHEFTDVPSENMKYNIKPHVIRCRNPNTEYIGDKNTNERLSLLLPFSLPQTGTDSVRELFEFVCKNSCPVPGMNRRQIEVIFTLENENAEILGRKALNVRICSCPKRDKEKDEKDQAGNPPHGKKRKLEKSGKKVPVVQDLKETTIQIPVVGKHNIDKILQYCQDLYSGEVIRNAEGPAAVAYKDVLGKITAMIKERSE